MTAAERGVLLLCCELGQSDARPLSMVQFRTLSRRVYMDTSRPQPLSRDLQAEDLKALAYDSEQAEHIVSLLDRESVLERYLEAMKRHGFKAITRISAEYPPRISEKLGTDAPPTLFCLGDISLLQKPCISLVGSRNLLPRGAEFARKVGRLAAEEGFVLASGGASGADTEAQNACLAAGGDVIVFTAGRLLDCTPHPHILYVSENGCEHPFSVQRALSRNHLIHAIGEKVFVAQTDFLKGGTWHGSMDNLRRGWTPIFVCDDASDGARGLCERGATAVKDFDSTRELKSETLRFL